MFFSSQNSKQQSGQTLIETMVAVFIMVMGITAALGLANYSLSASGGIRKQIIGMGLAREGVEAVKNMRDTNWLNGSISNDCYNFDTQTQSDTEPQSDTQTQSDTLLQPGVEEPYETDVEIDTTDTPAYCYRDWLNPDVNGFNLQPQDGFSNFAIDFDASTDAYWNPVNISIIRNPYRLYTNANYSTKGLYSHDESGTPSDFYRQVIIDDSTVAAPFNHDTGARLLVISRVWWIDKNCPSTKGWPGKGRCSIELQMYMTNWKTF